MRDHVVLITGASSGIGWACAKHLHALGYTVYAASRNIRNTDIEGMYLVSLDVDNDESVQRGIDHIINMEGRIDVAVNCAGFGIAGAVEDTSLEEAKAQFETNFFGVLRVCHRVLPIMRQQKSGLIVNVSSLAGISPLPFQALYSASKFAVEGLSEALRIEVMPFGIRVVLIEPGDFSTGFTQHRRKVGNSQTNAIYRERFTKALAKMEQDEINGPQPLIIARLIERIIKTPSPCLRYTVGSRFQKLGVGLKPFLPQRLYEWLLIRNFGLQ